ncbi:MULTISPECIES: choice-of-anchor C family protein [Streptosporangium]|uniref:Choice-of-anchor C domain-containing protein n=1 Tax=Streptosporangium brasiliense TaxID=47480 RepID=A0ABT9QX09_9ACTN|nr:choice-of-anchor C family protein [Streptosporangium brasiliense]MDP9860780.1 choice-of-anchor C domain-containing protein [Streptosporangium brasiliense]
MKRRRWVAGPAVALPAAFALALSASAGAHASAALPLIANGSFETPLSPGVLQINAGGTIGPWDVTAGSVDLIGFAGPWRAAKGRQSVDLSGGGAGRIEQSFATTAGRCYTVSYALAGNTHGGPVVKTGYARVTQGPLIVQRAFSFDTTGKTPQNMGYVREKFSFCAQDTTATLALVSTTAGVYGPAVDDVIVAPRLPWIGIGDLGIEDAGAGNAIIGKAGAGNTGAGNEGVGGAG